MKNVFSLRSRKGWWFWGINSQSHNAGVKNVNSRQRGYSDIHEKDLGKIHKAAVVGDVARVQEILLLGKSGLNDQDKQLRTALHLAAAHGHEEVVTLLVERKCQLNLCDSENRTALMKAVQCQAEACATLLLEHGADPNIMDTYGNTALHSAITTDNTAIAGKLLSHKADIEARNKAGLTPLLIAINEGKQEMAEFFIKEGANIHAVDKYRRFPQLISQFKQEQRLNTSSEKNNPVLKSSEEGSVWNLSSKFSIDDSHPISNDDHMSFEIQTAQLQSLKLMTTTQQCKKDKVKCDHVTPENASLHEDNNSSVKVDDVIEIFISPSDDQEFSPPDFPSPAPLLNPLQPLGLTKKMTTQIPKRPRTRPSLEITQSSPSKSVLPALTRVPTAEPRTEGATEPVIGKKEELGSESAPQQQADNYNLTHLEGRHKDSRHDIMSALGSEEEDVQSLWDLEVEEAKERIKSSEMGLSEKIYDAADAFDRFLQQRKSGNRGNQLSSVSKGEDSESGPVLPMKEGKKTEIKKWTTKAPVIPPVFEKSASLAGGVLQVTDDSSLSEIDWNDERCSKKSSNGKNKVKQQTKSADDLDDFIQSSETASEDCKLPSCNYKNFMSLIEQHGVNCKGFCLGLASLVNRFGGLLAGPYWGVHFGTSRVHKKIKEQLRKKKEQFSKEVEARQQLELRLRALDMELRTVRNNLEQVSGSDEREKDLLHKNHLLRDEIVMLTQEIETIKNQSQEKEKEYFDEIENIKEKNHKLRKTIQLNKETLAETICQHSQQLHSLKAEVAILNSKLESEKQNKERLETEVESCRSRLAIVLNDHNQSQASKRDLELTFQRAREEWLHLQEKINFDVAQLKVDNEALSQKLSSSERKFNNLEIELHHTRDALREKTVALEDTQRDLKQAQCQKKEIEHMYGNEQDKVSDYIAKQAALEKRVSQLQGENTFLREQLEDAQDKTEDKEKMLPSLKTGDELMWNFDLTAESSTRDFRQPLLVPELLQRQQGIEQVLYDMGRIEKENVKLNNTIKKQGRKIEQLQKNLLSTNMQMDDITVKLETASSAWPHLEAENQLHPQELSMEVMQNKCERPEKKKKLKQVIVNHKSPVKTKLVECCQVEKDMRVIEQTVQDIEEKVKEVSLLLQTKITSQEHLEQLIESHNTSVRSQMELSCKVLETEVSRMKTEKDSNRTELERYKHLYLEEVKARESLENRLSRMNDKLTKISSKRHMEKMHNRCLLSTFATRPSTGPPYVADLNHLVPYSYLTARQSSTAYPTSNAGLSNDSRGTYYNKVSWSTLGPVTSGAQSPGKSVQLSGADAQNPGLTVSQLPRTQERPSSLPGLGRILGNLPAG
ncbi:PREDICTED: ankyrin repeat domain-containing protein 26-like [Condylura cristata]|uniref:ankyrin repeat domain-containing protein 26-like n=1 Tax=Condylura cristata TaxID=143302 RepID=UPI0006437F40|nr:PREDICTED: ankyrin repeat domain-containing protein 26-like [Condylura cristata]